MRQPLHTSRQPAEHSDTIPLHSQIEAAERIVEQLTSSEPTTAQEFEERARLLERLAEMYPVESAWSSLAVESQEFAVAGTAAIDPNRIPGEVRIVPGTPGTVTILYSGGEKRISEISALQQENSIFVEGPEDYADALSGAGQKDPSQASTVIEIRVGAGTNLRLSGTLKISCSVDLGTVEARIDGESILQFSGIEALIGNLKGDTSVTVGEFNGGKIDLALEGNATATISGNFESVNVDASGDTKFTTRGCVRGDYKATAFSNGRIDHSGGAAGTTTAFDGGRGTISILY